MSSDDQTPFTVETSEKDGVVLVRASGEIDVATAPQVESQLMALIDSGSSIAVDLENVSFIDSSGLRALVSARQRADERALSLTLAGRSHAVERLLQVTGLDSVFDAN